MALATDFDGVLHTGVAQEPKKAPGNYAAPPRLGHYRDAQAAPMNAQVLALLVARRRAVGRFGCCARRGISRPMYIVSTNHPERIDAWFARKDVKAYVRAAGLEERPGFFARDGKEEAYEFKGGREAAAALFDGVIQAHRGRKDEELLALGVVEYFEDSVRHLDRIREGFEAKGKQICLWRVDPTEPSAPAKLYGTGEAAAGPQGQKNGAKRKPEAAPVQKGPKKPR